MTHDEFTKARDELLRGSTLIDRSQLNLYRSLAMPAISPSTHTEAPYRCHLAERFLAHLGFPAEWKARTHVSHGVRRSLRALFGVFADHKLRVAIPDDVYPVYLELARDAGLEFVPYASRDGLPSLNDIDVLLICEPSKPWGTSVDVDWKGLVVIDSAYATPPSASAMRLINAGNAMLLASLSKGWLIPDHGGICLVPPAWFERTRAAFTSLPKDELRIRIAYAALTEHATRPDQVRARLEERARALDAFTSSRPELKASRCVGYFAISALPFEAVLSLGVLGVPASVFGSKAAVTILSALQ